MDGDAVVEMGGRSGCGTMGVYMYSAIIPSQELVGNTERQITNRTRSRQHRQ